MQQGYAKHNDNANQEWEKQGEVFPVAGNNVVATITADLLIFPWSGRQNSAK